jgi:uncharacterized protein YabE (DUF348 family)
VVSWWVEPPGNHSLTNQDRILITRTDTREPKTRNIKLFFETEHRFQPSMINCRRTIFHEIQSYRNKAAGVYVVNGKELPTSLEDSY